MNIKPLSLVLLFTASACHPAPAPSHLSADEAQAVRLLADAAIVEDKCTGAGGETVSEQSRAWMLLQQSPLAEQAFAELFRRATQPAGKIYALNGIYPHSPAQYQTWRAQLTPHEKIMFHQGDAFYEQTTSDVYPQIENGSLTRRLAYCPPPP